jgi:hypothetical protein
MGGEPRSGASFANRTPRAKQTFTVRYLLAAGDSVVSTSILLTMTIKVTNWCAGA